ncbi:MAG TPA: hypothetical protein VKH19_02445 [Gemmatimonadaceae bacterium]|nr:hypothetical protein [Gemmatimonadaceae bacterium]
MITAVITLLIPGGPYWKTAITLAIWAAGLSIAAQRIEKGSRVDAVILFAMFVIGDAGRWLTGSRPDVLRLGISIVVFIALANAVLGAFALASVHRDAAGVPPAPGDARAGV